MGSGEAWRWGLLTPQEEGATCGGRCATRGLPCRLSLGAWRGLGPLWTQEPGQHPPPRCSLWGAGGGAGSPERGPMGGAPYILRLVPGAARPGGQEVTAQQGEHPRDPRAHMRACTHAHTHAHTHVTLSVHPSTRSRSWARAGGTR